MRPSGLGHLERRPHHFRLRRATRSRDGRGGERRSGRGGGSGGGGGGGGHGGRVQLGEASDLAIDLLLQLSSPATRNHQARVREGGRRQGLGGWRRGWLGLARTVPPRWCSYVIPPSPAHTRPTSRSTGPRDLAIPLSYRYSRCSGRPWWPHTSWRLGWHQRTRRPRSRPNRRHSWQTAPSDRRGADGVPTMHGFSTQPSNPRRGAGRRSRHAAAHQQSGWCAVGRSSAP